MEEIIQFADKSRWRQSYRYAVYEHKLLTSDGIQYSRSFIVIKNSYGVIIHFTKLHNFAGIYENKVFRPLTSDAKAKLYYICSMLNYILIEKYGTFRFDHVFEVTKESLECFFRDYALGKKADGGFRGSQSIEKCVIAVTVFFRKLRYKYGGHVKLTKEVLYAEHQVYTKQGKPIRKQIPDFQVRGIQENHEIFRDLPTKVFQILLNLALRYAPDIAFAVSLQAFAGLRPGEVCNVRQEGSPKGNGLMLTMIGEKVVKVEIDLTKEYAMRSDGRDCGKIKKERRQCVYPPFIGSFLKIYQHHKNHLAQRDFEQDYCPMFVNRTGMAMTYRDYYGRFRKLVEKHLRPMLLHHTDPECRIYGQMLYENRLGPHALRHWFSVQLVLRGEDIAQIQFWRGDKNPESAFDYLQNKGDLVSELAKANEMLAEILLEEGADAYGKEEKNGFL